VFGVLQTIVGFEGHLIQAHHKLVAIFVTAIGTVCTSGSFGAVSAQ
jgi:hypothetical protein